MGRIALDQPGDTVLRLKRRRPSNGPAPIMTDQSKLPSVKAVGQCQHVGHKNGHFIGGNPLRLVRPGIAPLVGRDAEIAVR